MENQNPTQNPSQNAPIQSPQNQTPDLASQGVALRSYRRFPIPKYVFLGIVFIILLVIIAGAYFLGKNSTNQTSTTPTVSQAPTPIVSDKTANWKNGVINKLTFKYPSVYNGGYVCGNKSVFFIDTYPIPQECPYGDNTPGFSLELIKNKTLGQINQDFLKDNGLINKTTENIIVDKRKGLLTKAILPPGQDVKNHNEWNLYIEDGENLYVFNSFDLHITSADQEKYFDQIFSTFRFD